MVEGAERRRPVFAAYHAGGRRLGVGLQVRSRAGRLCLAAATRSKRASSGSALKLCALFCITASRGQGL